MGAWGRHLAMAFLFAMALAFPRDAVAHTHSHCPEIWSDYVESARNVLAVSKGKALPVLFIGTGGEVHNCLGEKIDLEILRAVQRHETSLLSVFRGDISGTPKEWPMNVCTLAGARLEEPTYSKINLPYELSVLRGDMCTHRVAGAFNYELGYLYSIKASRSKNVKQIDISRKKAGTISNA